jgi:hypothetical protein
MGESVDEWLPILYYFPDISSVMFVDVMLAPWG